MSLDKLSELMKNSEVPVAGPAPSSENTAEDEAKLSADAEQVFKLIATLASEELFTMQVLVETVADEIRDQIREQFEG